jgi:cytochrome d ubiquinol oxidase subunit II
LRMEPQVQWTEKGLVAGKYALFAVTGFALLTFVYTDMPARPVAGGMLAASLPAVALCGRCLANGRPAWSLIFSTAAIALITAAIFTGLFPRFIISSLHPDGSLGIYDAAANPFTLRLMAAAMAVVLPLALLFEGWKYHIFRQKVNAPAAGFESRRQLWRQLHDRLAELIAASYHIRTVLQQAKQVLHAGRKMQKDKKLRPGTVKPNQIRQFRLSIRRGHHLAQLIARVLEILRK